MIPKENLTENVAYFICSYGIVCSLLLKKCDNWTSVRQKKKWPATADEQYLKVMSLRNRKWFSKDLTQDLSIRPFSWKYCQIFIHHTTLPGKHLIGNSLVFHTLSFVDWPPQNQELTIIETVWDHLNRQLNKKLPTSKETLFKKPGKLNYSWRLLKIFMHQEFFKNEFIL